MSRSSAARIYLPAIAALTLLSGAAERTSNSFFTIEGEGVRIASDGGISVDADATGPVTLTARSGWLVNGRESVTYRSARGLSSGLILTSKLGEDHFCSPPPPTKEDKHDTTFVLEADATPSNLIAMYALPSTSIVVTASAESSLVKKGKHKVTTTWQEWTCPVCGAHQEGRTEVSYYDVEPDTYEWTAEAAGVTQASSTWTGPMSKGTGQEIEFTVTGRRDSCQECVATATDTATADVHELSVERPDYLGLDRTDAGLSNWAVTNATARIDPEPTSATYNWTSCGKCQFVGATNEQTVTYGITNSAIASTKFLAEDLKVTATASNADGLSASATCTTNFTIVAVDVTIGSVGEDKEEKEGAFISYVADTNGVISVEGMNKMVEVKFTCKPSLPDNEMVTISHTGPGELYEVLASGECSLVTSGEYRACDVSNRTFKLHGHAASTSLTNGAITIEHANSGAKDLAKYTDLKVDLKEVSFSGTKYHLVKKDDGSMDYAAPHWQDNSSPLDGDASDANDRAYPICFTRNSKMKVSATWVLEPQGLSSTITVKGDGPEQLDFPETVAAVNGAQMTITDVECDSPFPDQVGFFDPMLIKWNVSMTSGGEKVWLDGGTSSNQAYVTLGDPLTTTYHTLAHLGCKNAKDETSVQNCTAKIWNEFTDRDVRRVDGARLTYYKSYRCTNTTTKGLLASCDGQCGAWAKLFIDIRKVQGIDDKDEYVVFSPIPPQGVSRDYVGFLVKNWTFSGTGRSGYSDYPYLNVLSDTDFISSTEYQWKYSDVSDATGIAGQGNENPASLFNNHQVVIDGKYYDPSYGVQYSSLEELEDRSIDGFYVGPVRLPVDEPVVGCDLNNDGDTADLNVDANVLLIRKNKPGLEIREDRYDL